MGKLFSENLQLYLTDGCIPIYKRVTDDSQISSSLAVLSNALLQIITVLIINNFLNHNNLKNINMILSISMSIYIM